jgi:hypothetical protein
LVTFNKSDGVLGIASTNCNGSDFLLYEVTGNIHPYCPQGQLERVL